MPPLEADGAKVLLLRRQAHLGRHLHHRQAHAPPLVNCPTGIIGLLNASYYTRSVLTFYLEFGTI